MGSLLFGMTGLKKAHVKTSEASFLTKVILPELRVQSLRSKFRVQSQTALGVWIVDSLEIETLTAC
jgi:hypothetical protein